VKKKAHTTDIVEIENVSASTTDIENMIFTIRGVQVMIDRDLAQLYGVLTSRLNEQVKRNIARFPESFRFQLTENERDEVIAKCDNIQSLKFNPSLPPTQGIFFDGQIFDAYTFVCDLVRAAKRRIVLFDNYVDDIVLTVLDKRQSDVMVRILTKTISQQLQLDINRHNAQYPPLAAETFANAHNRFLCIDDAVYHLGASLKDLGKKWFAFSKMKIATDDLLNKLQ